MPDARRPGPDRLGDEAELVEGVGDLLLLGDDLAA